MTSLRQIESNRRNALKSTGPKTDSGKRRASRNAMRHGLTAETVIEPFEDPEDYKAFEEAVAADYDAETAVERELVLRLASLLWRLKRATSIETGLFLIQDNAMQERQQSEQPGTQDPAVTAIFRRRNSIIYAPSHDRKGITENDLGERQASSEPPPEWQVTDTWEIALYFSQLATSENDVFARLGRYEAALWRQVRQTIFTLERLRWRGPGRRNRRTIDRWQRAVARSPADGPLVD